LWFYSSINERSTTRQPIKGERLMRQHHPRLWGSGVGGTGGYLKIGPNRAQPSHGPVSRPTPAATPHARRPRTRIPHCMASGRGWRGRGRVQVRVRALTWVRHSICKVWCAAASDRKNTAETICFGPVRGAQFGVRSIFTLNRGGDYGDSVLLAGEFKQPGHE